MEGGVMRQPQRQMSEQELRARAIKRAIGLGLAGEVIRVRCGWYQLPSTTRLGQVWTVRVVEGRYSCNCEAGRSGRPYVHQAAVFRRKTEAGGASVVAPAPARLVEAPANVLPFQRAA
jgi:hypothetical protein